MDLFLFVVPQSIVIPMYLDPFLSIDISYSVALGLLVGAIGCLLPRTLCQSHLQRVKIVSVAICVSIGPVFSCFDNNRVYSIVVRVVLGLRVLLAVVRTFLFGFRQRPFLFCLLVLLACIVQ
jgi:hypothetical protein